MTSTEHAGHATAQRSLFSSAGRRRIARPRAKAGQPIGLLDILARFP